MSNAVHSLEVAENAGRAMHARRKTAGGSGLLHTGGVLVRVTLGHVLGRHKASLALLPVQHVQLTGAMTKLGATEPLLEGSSPLHRRTRCPNVKT